MKYLFNYPIIILTVLFVCGIFLAANMHFSIPIILFISIILSTTSYILAKKNLNNLYQPIVLILLILLGILRFEFAENGIDKWEFDNNYIKKASIIGKITDVNLIGNNYIKLKVRTDTIKYGNKISYNKHMNLLVNVKIDTTFNRDKAYDIFKLNYRIKFNGNILNPPEKRIFGDFNYRNMLKIENIIGVAYTKYDSTFIVKKGKSVGFFDFFVNVRQSLDITLSKLYNYESYTFLRGIILGDRGLIDEDIKNNYSKSGVAHVLAVSGLHVGLIVYILTLILGRFDLKVRFILSILFVILFCNITGNSPSVIRATIMTIIFLFCNYFNRDYSASNSLFLSLFIILIINPFEIYSVGLQLSFISVLTIILITKITNKYFDNVEVNKRIKTILSLLFVTISCTLATLPILLINFHQISIIAVISNLFIIPLISFILSGGLISLVLGLLSVKLGIIFAAGIEKLVSINNFFVNFFANLKYSFVNCYNFTFLDGVIVYLALTILIAFVIIKNKKYLIVSSIIFTTLVFGNYSVQAYLIKPVVKIIIIDVGQGDSFFIKTKNGKGILIDSGNKTDYYDSGHDAIIPTLRYNGIKILDYVFITHIDSDHYLGLQSLTDEIKIKTLIKPKLDTSDKKDIKFEEFIRTKQIKVKYFSNSIITIDSVKLYILNDENYITRSSNEKSGVIKIVYGNNSFLFMGDATRNMELFYLNKYGKFLQSDVLKAGHHGSNSSSDSLFIEMVRPKYSIISCGIFNPYKLPSEKVINRLNRVSKVLRTDVLGTIIFESDGEILKVKNLNKNL